MMGTQVPILESSQRLTATSQGVATRQMDLRWVHSVLLWAKKLRRYIVLYSEPEHRILAG